MVAVNKFAEDMVNPKKPGLFLNLLNFYRIKWSLYIGFSDENWKIGRPKQARMNLMGAVVALLLVFGKEKNK